MGFALIQRIGTGLISFHALFIIIFRGGQGDCLFLYTEQLE